MGRHLVLVNYSASFTDPMYFLLLFRVLGQFFSYLQAWVSLVVTNYCVREDPLLPGLKQSTLPAVTLFSRSCPLYTHVPFLLLICSWDEGPHTSKAHLTCFSVPAFLNNLSSSSVFSFLSLVQPPSFLTLNSSLSLTVQCLS